jgi:hypothetical protein
MDQLPFLSKQEILDYASRYVAPEDAVDFAHDNDLFCILGRSISPDKVLPDGEGWGFHGYGLCVGYTVDNQEVPAGKWLWMHFVSLATFPPSPQTLKLQPPHVVKGAYQNPQRTEEYRIVKINLNDTAAHATKTDPEIKTLDSPSPGALPGAKVLEFRKKPAKVRSKPAGRKSPTHG